MTQPKTDPVRIRSTSQTREPAGETGPTDRRQPRRRPRAKRRCWRLLLVSLLAAGTSTMAKSDRETVGLELRGTVLRAGDGASAGADLLLEGGAVAADLPQGGGFVLMGANDDARLTPRAGGHSCLCDGLFVDGFESGDVSAWSASVP